MFSGSEAVELRAGRSGNLHSGQISTGFTWGCPVTGVHCCAAFLAARNAVCPTVAKERTMNHSNTLTRHPHPAPKAANFQRALSAPLLQSPRTQHLHMPQPMPDVVPLPPTPHPGLPGPGPDGPSPTPPPEMPPGMPPEVPPNPAPPEINDPVLPGEHSPVRDPVPSAPGLRHAPRQRLRPRYGFIDSPHARS